MHPSKPNFILNIGVAGHREVNDSEKEHLHSLCLEIFASIQIICDNIFEEAAPLYRRDAPQYNLISSVAEGFDRIAALVGLARGYHLVCPLPYARDEYANDFKSVSSKDEYYKLLNLAKSVYEIDFDSSFENPYSNAGSVMLEYTDLLLAFWDGSPAKGPGGTGDIVEKAIEKGIPVLVIDRNGTITLKGEGDWKTAVSNELRKMVSQSSS